MLLLLDEVVPVTCSFHGLLGMGIWRIVEKGVEYMFMRSKEDCK